VTALEDLGDRIKVTPLDILSNLRWDKSVAFTIRHFTDKINESHCVSSFRLGASIIHERNLVSSGCKQNSLKNLLVVVIVIQIVKSIIIPHVVVGLSIPVNVIHIAPRILFL